MADSVAERQARMASANSNQNVNEKLVIFKGDDTGGVFGRRLQFAIEVAEGADLTGCRAEWIFDGIVKTLDAPLTAGETREIFYSHNETERMCIGVRYGTFRIIDAEGKRATMTNTRAVEVTDNVARCYPGASAATVRIGTFISWENISGKPLLVKTVNGEAPDASGNINIKIEEPVLDDTVTEKSPNGVKSSGIWSWVKSLLPHWLTSDYAEPATVESVAEKLDRIVLDPLFEHNHSEFKQTLDGLDYTAYQTDGGKTEVLDIAHIGNKMVYVTEGSNWFTSGFHASEDYRGFGISQSSSDFKNGNFSTFYGDRFIDCGENEITIPNATGTMALMSTTLSGYGITDAAPLSMISATDTTFASAVRAVPTTDMPEDMPSDWGAYGTVGAALAALAAFVKWAKAKIVAVIGDDGKPTDTFATDLLGKQVANVKANTVSLAASYSETETYAVGDAVTHDGKLYKCAVAITTAETWTPAHWTETTVATLWNNADTTSYGGQN